MCVSGGEAYGHTQLLRGRSDITLSRAEVSMPEELLDRAQVMGLGVDLRGEAPAQAVRPPALKLPADDDPGVVP